MEIGKKGLTDIQTKRDQLALNQSIYPERSLGLGPHQKQTTPPTWAWQQAVTRDGNKSEAMISLPWVSALAVVRQRWFWRVGRTRGFSPGVREQHAFSLVGRESRGKFPVGDNVSPHGNVTNMKPVDKLSADTPS